MSRYQPYPEYKDSGVEWIGEVPAHWGDTKLVRVFKEKGKDLTTQYPPGAISFGEVVTKEMRNEETLASYQALEEGEFIVNPLNLNYDLKSLRVALSDENVRVSSGYIILRLRDGFQPRYVRWLMYLFDIRYMKTLGGGIRQTITFADIAKCQAAIPDSTEQSQIATFLDRETTRIDTLVEKKQRFIELLEEKRKAVITQAVTKGLDPNVPMKDSGVEWIGEVPAHWEVKRLKHVGEIVSGGTPKSGEPKFWDDDGVEWFTPADLSEGTVTHLGSSRRKLSPEGIKSCGADESPAGSIVISIRAPVGNIGMLSESGATNQGCKTLVPQRMDRSPVIASTLSIATPDLQSEANGTTFQELSGTNLSAFSIPWPPIQESDAIATFLDRETTRIDTLIEKTRESIERLKERRSALITAAVTGKIDVREEAAA